MSTKAIIEIPVDDADFQRFYRLFEEYSARLDEMPETWQRINDVMGESSETLAGGAVNAKDQFAMAAAQAGVISAAIRDAVSAQNDLGHATAKSSKNMDNLRKSAEGVGKAISFVGGWIVKLGAIGGLGALFSGFGIGELASSAFSRNRAAGGLGISPGLLASFQVNAQQYLNTSSLESAASSQLDIRNTPWFRLLGIKNAQSQSPSDLAFNELRGATESYRRYQSRGQSNLFMQTPEWMAYQALGGNIQDVRRAAQPGGLEGLGAAQMRTNAEVRRYELVDKSLADLKIKLDGAGMEIESSLINGLGKLAPEIGILADDISHFIDTFVKSKDFDVIVSDVKEDLKGMIEFFGRVDWVKIGDEINWLADKLGWLTPQKGSTPGTNDYDHAWQNWKNGDLSAIQYLPKTFQDAWKWAFTPYSSAGAHSMPGTKYSAGVDYDLAHPFDPKKKIGITNALHEQMLKIAARGYDVGVYDVTQGKHAKNSQHYIGNALDIDTINGFQVGTNLALEEAFSARLLRNDPHARIGASGDLYKWLSAQHLKVFEDNAGSIHIDEGADWSRYAPKDAMPNKTHEVAHHDAAHVKAIGKTLRAVLKQRTPKPATVAIRNSTAARVAISQNAVAIS